MHLDHIALWTDDIDRLTAFYSTHFGARAGARYHNADKGFSSCFLSFDSGARIELMSTTRLAPLGHEHGALRMGLTHLAISLGDEARVDALTQHLRDEGITVLDGPRRTGDGYYESLILDPDGNRLEMTA